MSPSPITILLDDRREHFVIWAQKLQHAVGGVPLLFAGIHRLQAPGGSGELLAYAEILVAAVLLGMLARDLRALRRRVARPPATSASDDHARTDSHSHAHAGANWFDVIAGTMLIVEAIHASSLGGKAFFARPNFLLGTVTIVIGLLHGMLARRSSRRRELRLDENGVHARLSRFTAFSVPWNEVRAIRLTNSAAIIDTTAGAHTIRLRRYGNASRIRAALEEWSAARTLPRPG
ncbi:MAG: hypothetical protein M3Y05_13670 [Gemmatimonadota bacterium]|nr:hypothetical protein [Gemmatimonadota bacterium]